MPVGSKAGRSVCARPASSLRSACADLRRRTGFHVEKLLEPIADRGRTVLAHGVTLGEALVAQAAAALVVDVVEAHLAIAQQNDQFALRGGIRVAVRRAAED